jgi:transcriptional regulator with XRE-family HTH domain
MFKNKEPGGALNISGKKIQELRKGLGISQRALADQLQLHGIDLTESILARTPSSRLKAGSGLLQT